MIEKEINRYSLISIETNILTKNIIFDDNMLYCELQDGQIVGTPLMRYTCQYPDTKENKINWYPKGGNHWEILDEDLSIMEIIET